MANSEQVVGTWILISIYGLIILFFVIRGALKIKNISDYAVGNINFSAAAVGLSLAASMTSAATFVINPGFIANYGISGVLSYAVFFPLGSLVSLVVLTKSFRKYGESVKALTLAQWIGKKYDSKGYALFMAFLSILLVTFIVLIAVAITKVLAKALNADEIWVLTGVIVFVFGYMMFGGANSMVYTNTIQALIMVVVAIILLSSGFDFFKDGLGSLLDKLAAIDPDLAKSSNSKSLLFRDFYEIIFAQTIVGIAVVVQPHIITKSLLLKKESQVNSFLTVAVVVEILFFLVVIAGLYARLLMPDLSIDGTPLKNDGIIPAYVILRFAGSRLSVFVGLIVVMGLLSAGLSTLEGLVQSVSSSVTSDIIKPLAGKKNLSDKNYILINKIVIICLAIVSWIISRNQILEPKLSVGILAQNGVYAYFSAAFVPVLFGIFFKDTPRRIAISSSIIALLVHFGIYYLIPFIHQHHALNLGFFTKFIEGSIRNPAIAASAAILISTLFAAIYYFVVRKQKTR